MLRGTTGAQRAVITDGRQMSGCMDRVICRGRFAPKIDSKKHSHNLAHFLNKEQGKKSRQVLL